jgi:peroxiredoxin
VAVLVIAAGLTAVLATRPPATTAQAASPLLGKQAPSIAGITVDGTHFTLPAQPGKYIVVNFFASWCEPCQQEEPNLVQFQYQHQRAGDASVVSVVIQDTVSAARSFQRSQGAIWPTMADPQGSIRLDYGVGSPPSTFVIAPDGRVVADYLGPVTVKDLDSVIQRAKAPSP